jgi:prepilin-type N-terminal cleavage/methylation domain-containing protein
MKLQAKNHAKAQAFTLIEMIGVLAVIAILAALLIPKVFGAINDARINSTCVSIETIKTATVDHYGKYGKFNSLGGTNDLQGTVPHFDQSILLAEQLLDKPFSAKIAGGDPSTNCAIQLLQSDTPAALGNNGQGYKLDGTNVLQATYLVEAVLYGVAAQDAKDLNDRVDSSALGDDGTTTDSKGRVEYANAGSSTPVYVYITHR